MERKKKGNFLLNSDFNCIGQGKGHAGKSKQQGSKVCGGKTAAGHCSKPVCLATSSDVLTKIISKTMTSPWCHKAQHSALVKHS